MDEVVWVDENDKILGSVPRKEAHAKGLWHRVSVIYIYNDKGEVLIQERADDGRLDHSSAGHVDPGETYLKAAKRELKEELGITVTSLTKIGTDESNHKWKGEIRRHKYSVYMHKGTPGKIDQNEVKKVFWRKIDDVIKDMEKDLDDNKFTAGIKVTLKYLVKNI